MNEIIAPMNVKRCAHCGGDASIEMVSSQYRVKCNQCEASTQLCQTPDEAICRWNRRYERTCNPVWKPNEWGFANAYCECGELLLSVANGLGESLPHYCHSCGAKVTYGDDTDALTSAKVVE